MNEEEKAAYRALGGIVPPEIPIESQIVRVRARLQITREWMQGKGVWDLFLSDYPRAVDWFDDDGVPK